MQRKRGSISLNAAICSSQFPSLAVLMNAKSKSTMRRKVTQNNNISPFSFDCLKSLNKVKSFSKFSDRGTTLTGSFSRHS